MLQAKNLEYSYDRKQVLRFPEILCERGEHWLLLGQSGCGKTTLLHLLGGLMPPQKGTIQIGDTLINKLSSTALDQFRGKHIGIVFQKSHFVNALTVEENLVLAQSLANMKKDRQRIKNILEQLNLGHKLKSKPDSLSQGEAQRVAIARAIINQPDVILADEPTSALDDDNCWEVIQLIEQQAKEANATLLIVTHDGRLKERFDKKILL